MFPNRRMIAVALLATATAGLLAACAGDPGGTPPPSAPASVVAEAAASPSPSEDSEEEAGQTRQQVIDDAEAGYVEYRAAGDDALMAPGDEQFALLQPHLGSEETITWWRSMIDQYAAQGLKQTGRNTVVSVHATDVVGHVAEAKVLTVVQEVCLDGDGVDVVRKDGTSALASASAQGPVLVDVTMERQADDRWTVVKDSTRQPFEAC